MNSIIDLTALSRFLANLKSYILAFNKTSTDGAQMIGCVASGSNSVAEGISSKAFGVASHAEGNNTEASGHCSHAEGLRSEALGHCSHAEGNLTVARNVGEHAEGLYNKSNKVSSGTDAVQKAGSTIHSVGIGNGDNDRKNAFEIMQNGDIYALGLGGYTGENPSSSVSMQQVIDAKYVKPTAGIPESDLSAGVRDFMMKHVIEEKEYDYTCTASSQAAGYIFFGNVVPTSEDPGDAWYIRYRMYIDLESESSSISPYNKYCHGVYECRVGFSGTALLYEIFNQMYSTSYRPIYAHVFAGYANSTEEGVTTSWETKYANRATNPVKIGMRIQSAYADTQPRHYRIELIETYNCSFEFLNAFETYGNIYSNIKYGTCPTVTSDNGLQENGDANDITTMQLTYSQVTAGASGIKMYSIIMQDAYGKWQSLTSTSGTGVSKTVNQNGFRLGSKLYYINRNSDVAANASLTTSQLRSNNAIIDLRYSLNINTTSGHIGNLVPYKPLYIVGSVNASDGLFYLDTPLWWTQDEPSTEDGKVYIKVCEAIYNDYANDRCYRGDFFGDGQIFWYKNGAFRTYESTALQSVKTINNQSMAGSGNINLCSSNITGGLAIVVVNSESEVGTDANTLYIVRQ